MREPADEIRQTLERLASDPEGLAARLEELGKNLIVMAAMVRAEAAANGGTRDPGGVDDRVRVQAVGPGGNVLSDTTTN